MKIISFIEAHQQQALEKILRHCGLWEGQFLSLPPPRPPQPRWGRGVSSEPPQLELVLDPCLVEPDYDGIDQWPDGCG